MSLHWLTSGLKQTNKLSQLQNSSKKLNLLTVTFLPTFTNCRRALVIISVRSFTVFEGNIVVTALSELVPLFFKIVLPFFFFFLRALKLTDVRLWQILLKIMFQSFWKPFKSHLYHYANKNVSVKPLSLICISSILTTTQNLFSSWKILHSLQP